MPDPLPRLLITLKSRSEIGRAADHRLPGVPFAYLEGTDPGRLLGIEAMLVGSPARELGSFDPRTLPALSFVQRIYTGLDGFPFERFPPGAVVAANAGAFAPFVAEHAVALALAAGHDLPGAREMVRQGRLRPVPGTRGLTGSTVVVLGFGAIGSEIARRLGAFGARIVGVNRSGAPHPECGRMFPADRLEEAVAGAAFVFETRPLTRATAGTLGRAALEAMAPDAVLVNVGRAGTVDEEALYRHLKDHPSFRAALDVWWQENFAEGTVATRFPFADLANFLGTPHMAAAAPAAEAYALDRAFENLARFFRGAPPLHIVDRREYGP